MANKNKAKGTRAESRVVNYLNEHNIPSHRKVLSGEKDEGDIQIENTKIVVEVKTGKQTANPNRAQLDKWLKEAWTEMNNTYGIKVGRKFGDGDINTPTAVLIIVRYRRKIDDADVWIQYFDGDGYFTRAHQFLDEWVDSLWD